MGVNSGFTASNPKLPTPPPWFPAFAGMTELCIGLEVRACPVPRYGDLRWEKVRVRVNIGISTQVCRSGWVTQESQSERIRTSSQLPYCCKPNAKFESQHNSVQ